LAEFPCVVSLLADPGVPGSSVVLSDPAAGVRQAVAHLHAQGRRKIVQALNYRDSALNRARRQALLDAQRELGLAIDPDCACLVADGLWEDAASQGPIDLCAAVLAAGADAVLADDDFCAALLIRALTARGRRVPDDVAVVGWGNETVSRFTTPALTTVDYQMRPIVEAALQAITASLGEAAVPQRVVVPPQLIVRESA
jgi:DNA-binding LacI/PurR family transcriptional regulator